MLTLFLIVNCPHAFSKARLEGITFGVTIGTGDGCGGDEGGILLHHDDLSHLPNYCWDSDVTIRVYASGLNPTISFFSETRIGTALSPKRAYIFFARSD